MILDNELVLSDAQAITNAAAASTKAPDLGAAGDAIGKEMYAVVSVNTSFTTADACTLDIAIQTATDSAFTSPITLLSVSGIAAADLAKGDRLLAAKLPLGVKQHIRAYYTPATGKAFTAGKLDAAIVPQVPVE